MSPSKYLKTLFGRDRRSALANLRLGTTNLELEKGRHAGIPQHMRFCQICSTQEVENEEHFLMACPALSTVRNTFLLNISNIHTNFGKLNQLEKVKFLYFNNNLDVDSQTIATDMLLELNNARDLIKSRVEIV